MPLRSFTWWHIYGGKDPYILFRNNWWWNRQSRGFTQNLKLLTESTILFQNFQQGLWEVLNKSLLQECRSSGIFNSKHLVVSLHVNKVNRRVTSILLSSEDTPLLLDNRSLNEKNIFPKGIEWVNTLMKS